MSSTDGIKTPLVSPSVKGRPNIFISTRLHAVRNAPVKVYPCKLQRLPCSLGSALNKTRPVNLNILNAMKVHSEVLRTYPTAPAPHPEWFLKFYACVKCAAAYRWNAEVAKTTISGDDTEANNKEITSDIVRRLKLLHCCVEKKTN